MKEEGSTKTRGEKAQGLMLICRYGLQRAVYEWLKKKKVTFLSLIKHCKKFGKQMYTEGTPNHP